jgi:acyl carrier protein phosphodiesterase
MNYLAHAYLSFDRPGILAGNLFSDFVKGRKKFDFPPEIQKGIALHRSIDMFTDNHDATKEAREFFRPAYRLYCGAFVDVVYDHFLAVDKNEFPDNALEQFSRQVYRQLDEQQEWFPDNFALLFPFMKSQNWLLHYASVQGTEKSFGGLVRRAAYMSDSGPAIKIFEQHYQRFQNCYRQFWAQMKPFARQRLEELSNTYPGEL